MKSAIKMILVTTAVILISFTINAQARLIIENNSQRTMTVKEMKGNGVDGSLYKMVTILPYSNSTIYFSESGYYFTKTKAVLNGK